MRKRVLVVSVAGLMVLGAAMTTSFLGNTGTTTASVTNGTTTLLYPVAAGLTGLPSAVNQLKYTPASDISGGTVSSAVLPAWSPSASSSGSVTIAGDLALVDASSASHGVNVNLYITNLAGMQQDYNSFALPVNVYSSPCASNSCAWTQSAVVSNPPTYITSSSGELSFNLPAGSYYDITVDTGGSYYCVSTSTTGSAALAPSFYLTAQAY